MKRYILGALALSLVLLCACAPKEQASSGSSAEGTRPPTAADLLPDPQGSASSQGEEPDSAQPDPAVSARWREEYRYDAQVLGRSLSQVAGEDDMTVLGLWPQGREYAGTETASLLFSGPAGEVGSLCAAVALNLHQQTTVDELRLEWGDALTFSSDDSVAGPCWLVTDGDQTYRFRTDETGNTLVEEGCLVLSMDSLLPQHPSLDWLIPARTWPSYWVDEPGTQWDGLLAYAQALSSSETPSGATQQADGDFFDLFFAQRGVKDPDTGVQYLSSGIEGDPWDGVVVPATLILGQSLPQSPQAVMDALDTPFYWGAFNLVGYWFYLDQYAVCLTSDLQGGVGAESYFYIRWGDNAG